MLLVRRLQNAAYSHQEIETAALMAILLTSFAGTLDGTHQKPCCPDCAVVSWQCSVARPATCEISMKALSMLEQKISQHPVKT